MMLLRRNVVGCHPDGACERFRGWMQPAMVGDRVHANGLVRCGRNVRKGLITRAFFVCALSGRDKDREKPFISVDDAERGHVSQHSLVCI